MGASIADILSNKEKSQLVLPNINKGDVFKMRLTPKEGIIPKNKGDNDRDKYFIVFITIEQPKLIRNIRV